MFKWFSRLTTNQRLAFLALVLGAAAVGASPSRRGEVTVHPQEIALAVQRDADQVTVGALAADLVEGRASFRVLDVRAEAAYLAYHVPTAENVPIASLASADLPKNEKFLVYGEDGVRAAQAWFLLRARGYRGAYMLRGGLAEWRDQVLYPVLQQAATDAARRENEQRAAVAAYFGGAPRTGAASAAAPVPPAPGPTVAAAPVPQLPPGAAKAKAAVKRKEGC